MFTRKKISLLLVPVLIFMSMPLFSMEKKVADSAAEYICIRAKEGKKKNLAVYPFTEKNGESSADSQAYATRIIEVILNKKEFKVIDPDKVSKIVAEQEKGLTGLVDPDTAPETGKMIGADAMIFGIKDKTTLQIRILDSVTGEVIGATVAESGGSAKASAEDFKSGNSRKKFFAEQTMRNLVQMYNNFPKKFVYITANDSEYAEMEKKFPLMMGELKHKFEEINASRKAMIDKKRKKFLQIRSENSDFDSKIKEMRQKVLDDFSARKEKRKKGKD
jgi:hypothetical protein